MKDNWKIVCDKVSTTKDLLEMPFEKGVASLILSGLGWNDFNDNIEEQYVISDHIKDYRVDFALIPKGKFNPEILVELKKTSHKQRKKDIAQIRTYMMLTNCRFCLYFGEKIELFFMENDGDNRDVKSVLNLPYDVKNPDGNRLLNLIVYNTYDAEKLADFCKTRILLDHATKYYTEGEGKDIIFELMAERIGCGVEFAKLLSTVMNPPTRKEQIVEEIEDIPADDKSRPQIAHGAKMQKKTSPDDKPHSWLIPYNKKYFDLEGCFKKYGVVYWRVSSNLKQVKKGDTGYIYGAAPEGRIRFQFEVAENPQPYSPIMDQDDEFTKTGKNSDNKDRKYFLVRVTGETKNKALCLRSLMEHGLNNAPMGAMMLSKDKYKELKKYIEENF